MVEFQPDFDRLRKVLLRDGEPDIVPFYELFADAAIVEAITGKQYSCESNVEFFYKSGYDFAYTEVCFCYPTHRNSTDDTSSQKQLEGKRNFVDDNHGMIENREDFGRYGWPVIDSTVAGPINETAKYLPDRMKSIVGTGGILENVQGIMGYVPLSYAIYEDEQLVADMFDRIGEDLVKVMKTCLENIDMKKIGAIMYGDDMGHSHSTILSPELLRKYVFPWHKKFVDMVHGYDLPVILHSCGNLKTIMDEVINLGFDAKHSNEDKIMPIEEVKSRYGSSIAILGGVDVNFLCTANEAEIREYVSRVIRGCAPGGGFALGTGNSVANYIPVNNYLTMLDEGRKIGVYPIK